MLILSDDSAEGARHTSVFHSNYRKMRMPDRDLAILLANWDDDVGAERPRFDFGYSATQFAAGRGEKELGRLILAAADTPTAWRTTPTVYESSVTAPLPARSRRTSNGSIAKHVQCTLGGKDERRRCDTGRQNIVTHSLQQGNGCGVICPDDSPPIGSGHPGSTPGGYSMVPWTRMPSLGQESLGKGRFPLHSVPKRRGTLPSA